MTHSVANSAELNRRPGRMLRKVEGKNRRRRQNHDEPIRLLIMIPIVPPAFSGAGQRGWRMARGFKKMGLEVKVVTYTRQAPTSDDVPVARVRGWTWRSMFPRGSIRRKVAGGVGAVVSVAEIWQVIRRHRTDLVFQIGCDLGPQLAGAASLLSRTPFIAEATLAGSDDALTIQQGSRGAFRFRLLRAAELVTHVSPRLAEAGLKAGLSRSQIRTIGNEVDTEHFKPLSREAKRRLRSDLKLPQSGLVYISVGAIIARKGILPVVRAFHEAVSGDQTSHLILVGPAPEGPYLDELRDTVTALGLEGRVRMTGAVPDAAPWMQASDVFVFASREEGFGTVLPEAMAVGLPVVVREIPMITRYIVGEVPGVRIVPDDEDLAGAMVDVQRFVRNEDISIQLRRRVIDKFADHVIYERYVKLFQECIESKETASTGVEDPRDLDGA